MQNAGLWRRGKAGLLNSKLALFLLGFLGPVVVFCGLYALFALVSRIDDHLRPHGFDLMKYVKDLRTPAVLLTLLVAGVVLIVTAFWTRWQRAKG